ncbi:MAG TPA: N-6 DNA methylase [Longimicrobium sp.]
MRQRLLLSELDTWKLGLGLLPVSLYGASTAPRYVLLNGAAGNFCLDLSEEGEADPRSTAWSADVRHHVRVYRGFVEVRQWDVGPHALVRFNEAEIAGRLPEFHHLLERAAPRRPEASVVAHSIKLFRRMRSVIPEGQDALRAFLYLMASVTERDRDVVALGRWGLDESAVEAAQRIGPNAWARFQEELTRPRPHDGLVPDLHLILRHASGRLFQDAHYVATEGVLELDLGLLPDVSPVRQGGVTTGVHFTPLSLVRTIVQEALAALDWSDARREVTVFDPACGSGEFLREAVRQIGLHREVKRIRVIGWDHSQPAVDMARFALAWETRDLGSTCEVDVVLRDSLLGAEDWPRGVDLVLMNPPFVSWREMDEAQRDAVSKVMREGFPAKQDMATAFLWLAARCLGDGGVLGTVLPASFLDGTLTRPVRAAIAERMSPRLTARLGNQQLFAGALVDSGVYIGKAGGAAEPPLAVWADFRESSGPAALRHLRRLRFTRSEPDLEANTETEGYSIYLAPELGTSEASWAPRPRSARLLMRATESLPRVSELFDVKQGTLTGLNEVFIVRDTELAGWGEERHYFRPAILNDSIVDGVLTAKWYVFYPHGERTLKDEPALRRAVPRYFEAVLHPNRPALQQRSGVIAKRWWELTRARAWQLEPTPKLVSTYFGDTGSFAWDNADEEFVVVQGYGWNPRKRLLNLQARGSVRLEPAYGHAYLALLNSELFSRLLAATSNSMAGGQWNLSARFTKLLPLPELRSEALGGSAFPLLAAIGETISVQGVGEARRRFGRTYQETVAAVYGFPPDL